VRADVKFYATKLTFNQMTFLTSPVMSLRPMTSS